MIKTKFKLFSKQLSVKSKSSFIKEIVIDGDLATVNMNRGKSYVYYLSPDLKKAVIDAGKSEVSLSDIYNLHIRKGNKSVAKY